MSASTPKFDPEAAKVPISIRLDGSVLAAIKTEAERLISQEKVEIVNGVFASAHAVPLAARFELVNAALVREHRR